MLALVLVFCLAVIIGGVQPTAAQEPAPPAEAAAEDDPPPLPEDEVAVLIAPVALYPDPVLILVLQASTQPLQVVQAERFLDRYAKDNTLQPDPEWDSSIVGLLNYPTVLTSMNEYIDWTEAVGDSVIYQLDDVQSSIQDIRRASYTTGILQSNDRQDVIVDDAAIRIMPADPETIALPTYDPVALLAAIQPAEGADVVEDELDIDGASEDAAEGEAGSADEGLAEDVETGAPAAAGYAAAPADSGYYTPYAPAAAPMPVAYENTGSSFWGSAATFAGGAAVGGLLGYALFDDDDDNDHWYGGGGDGRSVNIEDSTIITGNDALSNRRIEDELRNRRGDRDGVGRGGRDRDRVGRGDRDRGKGVAPAHKQSRGVARDTRKKDVRLPGSGGKTAKSVQAQRSGAKKATKASHKRGGGLTSAQTSRSKVNKDASRGKKSRGVAASKGRKSAASASRGGSGAKKAAKSSRGNRGGVTNVKSGKSAKNHSKRGKKSKGGKKKRG